MNSLLILTLAPLVPALLLFIIKNNFLKKHITRISVGGIIALSIYTAYLFTGSPAQFFALDNHLIDKSMFIIECLMAVFIFILSIKYKKYITLLLSLIQISIVSYYEFFLAKNVFPKNNLFVDQFSIIMILIIGVIGGLICVYAVGYMKDFHHHHTATKDRSRTFFFILFVFLSAMFGLVLSNNLVWLLFFWEITTLASFLLIGYTRTETAVNNSFRALSMNLAGGIAFSIAIAYLAKYHSTIEMSSVLAAKGTVAMLPIALLCFAGITKSAQLPFSSWLLGAMVAPTPTSALLHSSTMVKAGVYLVIRFAPFISGTHVGNMVALVGALTFIVGAFIAVSQQNAKKVLAYSTVSNLGIIIACAGIGTYETIWAAIFLIIFHAIAKSLLFLCVGSVEHRIGSRDIEMMDGLLVKMPALAALMIIGICGMFVAPFGMLISKWAALKAFIHSGGYMSPVLVLFLSYGSAVTLFFWTKWMGKLTAQPKVLSGDFPLQKEIPSDEWASELVHAFLTIAICLTFPIISSYFVEPYISSVFGRTFDIGKGNFIIMTMMVSMIIIIPLVDYFLQKRLPHRMGTAYMAGRNQTQDRVFDGSLGVKRQLTLSNYYLEKYFGEKIHMRAGVIIASITLAVMLGVSLL